MITITTKSMFLTIILLCGFLNTTTKIFGMELTATTAQFTNADNETFFMELFTKEKNNDLIHTFTQHGSMSRNNSLLLSDPFDNRIKLEALLEKDNSLRLEKDKNYFGTIQLTPLQYNAIVSSKNFGAPIYAMTSDQYYHLKFPKENSSLREIIRNNNNGKPESSSSIDFDADNDFCDNQEITKKETDIIGVIIDLLNDSANQLPENIKFYIPSINEEMYTQIYFSNDDIILDTNDLCIDSSNIIKEDELEITPDPDNLELSVLKKYLSEGQLNAILSYTDLNGKTTYVQVTTVKNRQQQLSNNNPEPFQDPIVPTAIPAERRTPKQIQKILTSSDNIYISTKQNLFSFNSTTTNYLEVNLTEKDFSNLDKIPLYMVPKLKSVTKTFILDSLTDNRNVIISHTDKNSNISYFRVTLSPDPNTIEILIEAFDANLNNKIVYIKKQNQSSYATRGSTSLLSEKFSKTLSKSSFPTINTDQFDQISQKIFESYLRDGNDIIIFFDKQHYRIIQRRIPRERKSPNQIQEMLFTDSKDLYFKIYAQNNLNQISYSSIKTENDTIHMAKITVSNLDTIDLRSLNAQAIQQIHPFIEDKKTVIISCENAIDNSTTYVRVTSPDNSNTSNISTQYNKPKILLTGTFIATILVVLAYKFNCLPDALGYYITNVKDFVSSIVTKRLSLSLFKK
jgi:hypothetical protein